MEKSQVRSGGNGMKKVSILFIICMLVLSGNAIAAPLTTDHAGVFTNAAGNTGQPFEGSAVQGLADNGLALYLGNDRAAQWTGGSLGDDAALDSIAALTDDAPAAPVPEPASLLLLGVGLLSAGFFARKKRQQ